MYIPTQQERYSKAAKATLLLCIVVPSGVVAWLYGYSDLMFCLCGFLWPIALPLCYMGVAPAFALGVSAAVQAAVFWGLVRTPRFTPKNRLTFAVTWGMLFALLLRVAIAFEVWRQVSMAQ